MSRGRRYTAEEDERIRDAFTPRRVRIQEAAAEMGRTELAIRRRWQRLTRGEGGVGGMPDELRAELRDTRREYRAVLRRARALADALAAADGERNRG